VIGAQIKEEIDIMSIIQFREISIVVSFNADARFVDIKVPSESRQDLQDYSGFSSTHKILKNPGNPVYFHSFRRRSWRRNDSFANAI
jgi:hypothetical protein